jgi:hypothetical protein
VTRSHSSFRGTTASASRTRRACGDVDADIEGLSSATAEGHPRGWGLELTDPLEHLAEGGVVRLTVAPVIGLAHSSDGRLSQTWIALFREQLTVLLAGTSGVEIASDLIAYSLAGADVVKCASAFLRNGIHYSSTLLDGLDQWGSERRVRLRRGHPRSVGRALARRRRGVHPREVRRRLQDARRSYVRL